LSKRFDYEDRKRTVKEVIEWLKQFPEDAYVYAYSGECTGIAVVSAQPEHGSIVRKELGWMETSEALFTN